MMNRKDFLKTLLGVPVAVAIARPTKKCLMDQIHDLAAKEPTGKTDPRVEKFYQLSDADLGYILSEWPWPGHIDVPIKYKKLRAGDI